MRLFVANFSSPSGRTPRNPRRVRPLDSLAALLLLIATGAVLIVGELLGGSQLSVVGNHISEFAARPGLSGRLVCAAMWGFGLTYLATAATLLRAEGHSAWVRWGCLCLGAAAALLPFVAEYRLWVPPPEVPRQPGFWDWLIPPRPKAPSMPPDWSVRQEVHGNAILASMFWVMGGMILIGFGSLRSSLPRRLAVWSFAGAAGSFLLFRKCADPSVTAIKGLVEWLAFGCVAAWIVAVLRAVRPAKAHASERPAGEAELSQPSPAP